MRSPLSRFLKDGARIALVGASDNKYKFGNIILKDLVAKGFDVIPINPNGPGSIEGIRVFQTLQDLPKKPDVVNFVVPPEVAAAIASDAVKFGHLHLWFQPGTQSRDLYQKLKDLKKCVPDLEWEAHSCIMDETRMTARHKPTDMGIP